MLMLVGNTRYQCQKAGQGRGMDMKTGEPNIYQTELVPNADAVVDAS